MCTLIIAEIGENHIGDMALARRMVQEAAAAGADMVKFQSYLASDVSDGDPEKEWFAKVQLSDDAHRELRGLAEQCGVEFLSAPFSLGRARFLCDGLGLRQIKIASCELLNFPLLEYVSHRAETVFLSTGMATLEEIRQALAHLTRPRVYILHCVTQYPTEPKDANLRAIQTIKAAFPQHGVGYSDHTIGIEAAVAAVALGAQVIEKHFTLDKNLPGTDHVLSCTPEELREMVRRIRLVETLLGSPEKRPTPAEAKIISAVRSRFPKGGR